MLFLVAALLLPLGVSQCQAQNNQPCCSPDYSVKVFVTYFTPPSLSAHILYNSTSKKKWSKTPDVVEQLDNFNTGYSYLYRFTSDSCTYLYKQKIRDHVECVSTDKMVFQGNVTIADEVYYKWHVTDPNHLHYNKTLHWDNHCIPHSYLSEGSTYQIETEINANLSMIDTFNTSQCVLQQSSTST